MRIENTYEEGGQSKWTTAAIASDEAQAEPMFPMFPHPIYVIAVVVVAVLLIAYLKKRRDL